MDKKILKIANEFYDMKDFAYTRLNPSQLTAASKAFNPLDIKTGKIPAYDIVRMMSTANYLWWAAKILLNITLSPMQALVLEELWTRPFPMLIGSRGFSKCITKDTMCVTENGIIDFEEFLELDKNQLLPLTHYKTVTNFYGENGWNKTDYAFYNGKTPTIKIINNLGISLEGTNNHPIRTLRNNKIEWVNLEDLKIGDIVPISRKVIKLKNKHKDINEDIAWWLGAIVGDGMVSQESKILFTNTDKELVDKWCEIGQKFFNKKPGFIAPFNYVFYGKQISKDINNYYGLYNKKAHDKNIPRIIRESGSKNLAAFIRGLMDTDGHVAKNLIGYSSVSEKLIKQVQQVLLCFGIISRISENYTVCNNKRFKSYKLYICDGESIKNYAKYIGFVCKRKVLKLNHLLSKKSNPNKGNIPKVLINDLIFKLEKRRKEEKRFFSKKACSYKSKLVSQSRLSTYDISNKTLKKILKIYDFAKDSNEYIELEKIYNSNYYYSTIENIEKSENDTYDVHIPNDHSFLSNGYISHNTFLLSLYVMLKLRLVPGSKIVVCGAAYRQSKFVFQEANKMWDAGDVYRSTCGRNDGPHTFQDKCSFFIGKSEAHFVPVGDGQTIRGLRAHTVIMDEFGSVNPEIYEVVISGFGAVAKNPIENMNLFFKREYMIKEGTWTAEMEENFASKGGNQSILSGTCTYDFEHFARYWKVYKTIIESRGDMKKLEGIMGEDEIHKLNWKDYSIVRIPYELIPPGIMDANTVARARASMTNDAYNREYGAVFSKDSAGFIKSSLIRSCVANSKNSITINDKKIIYTAKINGDKNLKYVLGVDPASEVDNMAITVLELHEDHTRIVNCWTINRKKHQQKVLAGIVKENDYFQYCVQKIRDLMSVFPCAGIYMDAQGGGRTLEQALATPRDGSISIYPIIEEGNPQITDDLPGLHILTMCQFVNQKWVQEANHGLKYDLEQKLLLFPDFDSVTLAIAHQEDKKKIEDSGIKYSDIEEKIGLYDTLEDCMFEIEELKSELSSIVHTKTPTGSERWDTPETKVGTGKKSRMRKDRYSSLVMANMGARQTGRIMVVPPTYNILGFLSGTQNHKSINNNQKLYASGPLANISPNFYGRPKR